MSFAVGTNSYAAVADADTYHADRGNTAWAALANDRKEQCLILATDYIDQRFGGRFIGNKVADDQPLEWPRSDTIYAEDEIPAKLQSACFEYALRASSAPLAPDPQIDASGVTMVTTMQKAGPVEQRFERAAGTSQASTINILRPYPGADMYLRTLVVSGGDRVIR